MNAAEKTFLGESGFGVLRHLKPSIFEWNINPYRSLGAGHYLHQFCIESANGAACSYTTGTGAGVREVSIGVLEKESGHSLRHKMPHPLADQMDTRPSTCVVRTNRLRTQ